MKDNGKSYGNFLEEYEDKSKFLTKEDKDLIEPIVLYYKEFSNMTEDNQESNNKIYFKLVAIGVLAIIMLIIVLKNIKKE